MKTIYFIALAAFICITGSLQAQEKKEKDVKNEQLFNTTLSLVESNRFQIEINRVYPRSGHDASRFNPRGTIIINDTLAEGNLPFFGRAYTLPYGEGGGIEFKNNVEKRTIKINEKKKKNKMISYDFSVRGNNDVFKFHIEISIDGNCSVSLSSNNRENITYSGTLTPLKDTEKKE